MFSVFVLSVFNLELQWGWQHRLSSPSSNDLTERQGVPCPRVPWRNRVLKCLNEAARWVLGFCEDGGIGAWWH